MMLAIIPARKGSKGIVDKNMRKMCGKPLIQWTIDAVNDILPTVVTTDYEHSFDVDKIMRPESLCGDDVPMLPVVQHAVSEYEKMNNVKVTSICLLQPTSPLRTSEDIRKCLSLYRESGIQIMSGYQIKIKQDGKVFDKNVTKDHFQRNGAIFITPRDMLDDGYIFNEYSLKYVMPLSRSIDVDYDDDWYIAESLLKRRGEC